MEIILKPYGEDTACVSFDVEHYIHRSRCCGRLVSTHKAKSSTPGKLHITERSLLQK